MEIVGRKSKSGAAVLMTGRGSCGECSSKVKWQVCITWRCHNETHRFLC